MADGAQRTYGGVVGEARVAGRRERLMAAGLDLLGAPGGSRLTVRGVCKSSGLIARYFYESFADVDALAVAVHDAVIADLVDDALAALASAPKAKSPTGDDRLRAGLAAIVDHLAEDPRRGHVIFGASLSVPVLTARRPEVVAMFAQLLRAEAGPAGSSPSAEVVARFLVGGFGEVLTAWLSDELTLSQDALVDLCVALFATAGTAAQEV